MFRPFTAQILMSILRTNTVHFLCWLVLRNLELYQVHIVDNFLHSCYLFTFENVRIIYIPITPGSQKSKDLPPIYMMHYLLTKHYYWHFSLQWKVWMIILGQVWAPPPPWPPPPLLRMSSCIAFCKMFMIKHTVKNLLNSGLTKRRN